MKAAVYYGVNDLRISEVDVPKPGRGQVLIKVKATAVCGTDVGIYKGKVPVPVGRILGHESTGEVVELGPDVTSVKVGDRIAINPISFCRSCEFCFEGKTNLCKNGGLMGREVNGTYAEYAVVDEFNAVPMPENISYEAGTTLTGLSTCLRGLDNVKLWPNMTVGIFGLGPAGLLHTRLAVLYGAKTYATTRSQWKLDIAKGYGAEIINAKETDPVQAMKDVTNGNGVDLAIECAGSKTLLKQAMEAVKPGGTVMTFGIMPPMIDEFMGYQMYIKELHLQGSRGCVPANFVNAVELVSSGKLDCAPLLTHNFKFDQTVEALDFVHEHGNECLRVVIEG